MGPFRPRVTIFGDGRGAEAAPKEAAEKDADGKDADGKDADGYEARKEDIDLEDRWGDYTFYRMNNVIDVYFVGGFGTLNWVDLKEYRDATPDKIVTPASGSSVLDTLAVRLRSNRRREPATRRAGATPAFERRTTCDPRPTTPRSVSLSLSFASHD